MEKKYLTTEILVKKFKEIYGNKKYGLSTELTETEMTERLGYFKIYDCGLIRYV